MNEKEIQLLQMIKGNPYISQSELAEKSGLSRSAVAGYISTLTKKGKILGRAYVIPERKGITCIGGANVDRKYQVTEALTYETSNPVTTGQSCGGVARNISENLGRIGYETFLISAIGDDPEGKWLLEQTAPYVNISGTQTLLNERTGTYTAILDKEGEMKLAFADMGIYDSVDIAYIEKRWSFLSSSEMVIVDTNLSQEVLGYILKRCKHEEIPISIATVSVPKIKNLPTSLDGVSWFICNKDEAEALLETTITTDGDLLKAAEGIIRKGANNAVITRGEQGLAFYTEDRQAGILMPPKLSVQDVTGAGDSLVAGIIYGHLKGANAEGACKIGITLSAITVESPETVSSQLSKQKIQEVYKRFFK